METGQDVLAEASQGIPLNEVGSSVGHLQEQPNTLNRPSSTSPLCSPAKLGCPPKQQRKVSFPDDSSLVRSLEPYDPWKDGEYTEEVVEDCIALRSTDSELLLTVYLNDVITLIWFYHIHFSSLI